MHPTFGQKVAAGFAVILALTVLIGVVAAFSLQRVVAGHDRLLTDYMGTALAAEQLNTQVAEMIAFSRGYMLKPTKERLASVNGAREAFRSGTAALAPRLAGDAAEDGRVARASEAYFEASGRLIDARRRGAAVEAVAERFDQEVVPSARALQGVLDDAATRLRVRLDVERRRTSEAAQQAVWVTKGLAALALALGTGLAFVLTRQLTRQIGDATAHLQSSSAELQAAASQQATGAAEQAAAMNEVSTTMKELLSTSRQIAQSSQRVASIADETAASADQGDQAVVEATEAIRTIQRQVDQIVHHMLALGQKTQQIGAVLEIIKELAEQTNILSINATIEAAGAGDHGRRFAAVADEIRKLADRVGHSAAEVRDLIEEVRSAANTTVMVTEDGSKAVEAGTRRFGELAATFHRIVGQVGTTAEAAREIELSTKQQTTAVEQVNLAIADAAQAATETEASSRQTMQTSSQLAMVSRELSALARRQA